MGRGEKLPLALAAAVLALALLAAYHYFPPHAELRKKCEVTLSVKGHGLLLANDSLASRISVTSPCRLVVRAVPEEGWKLAKWLVNGSEFRANPTLELEVQGNTTVVAVFEQILCSVKITSQVPEAEVYVNSSRVSMPYEAIVPWGSLLVIETRAPEGFEQDYWLVNGSKLCADVLKLTIKGNTTVEARFKRVKCRVVVVSPHPLYLNGLKVYGYSDLLPVGSELNVTAPVKVRLGFNGSHEIYDVLSHFLVNGEQVEAKVKGRYATLLLEVGGDLRIEAAYRRIARRLTGNATILVDGRPYPINLTTSPYLVLKEPTTVKVEGEWIEVRGGWVYYVTLPEDWEKVIIRGVAGGYRLWWYCFEAEIVVENCPTFLAKGVSVDGATEEGLKEFVFLFTRHPFTYKCLKGCQGYVIAGPSKRCKPLAIPYRTLMLTVSGYVRFRIEVVTGG